MFSVDASVRSTADRAASRDASRPPCRRPRPEGKERRSGVHVIHGAAPGIRHPTSPRPKASQLAPALNDTSTLTETAFDVRIDPLPSRTFVRAAESITFPMRHAPTMPSTPEEKRRGMDRKSTPWERLQSEIG